MHSTTATSEERQVQAGRAYAKNVEGWLGDEEADLLFEMARTATGRGRIAEIGSWKGKSTIHLASGSLLGPRTKILAIDPHTGSPEHQTGNPVWTFDSFRANVRAAGVEDMVEPLVATSVEAAKRTSATLEVLFVDGAHEYEAVKEDVRTWLPRMLPGSTMIFHDSNWPGVRKALKELVYHGTRFRNVRVVGTMTYAEVVPAATLSERIQNRARWPLAQLYEWAYPRREQMPRALVQIGKRLTNWHG